MTQADKGGRKPRVTDKDLLDVFHDAEDPVLSTAEVAESVPIKRRGTLNRLRGLEDAGDLESKQIGGRNTVWWLAGLMDTESDRSETPADTSGENLDAESADTRAESDTLDDGVNAAIEAVDTPGSGETLRRRREALREMYDYLKEHGTARRSDFAELVDAESVGYGSFNSFWNNYVKAKDALKQLPNVDPPGEGEHTWRFKA
ncbi:hypothetical protein DM867_13075 [Halosegnis rubeus]|uniref:Uncharacterized protein n=1 Tax=Halosegnis rubeus TaxID=2212850 RepID=A0A5N5U1Q2_9EURY|nr:hypothetical protein [Halosegnis rubeus]KAB7512437.1 hypothetical protein DM867_13075 [Halosegnis rubeus]